MPPVKAILCPLIVGGLYLGYIFSESNGQDSSVSVETKVKVHETTGLIIDEGFELVAANCLGCHSGKLIAQNRASREGWKNLIRWMQKTQKLWDLGSNEDAILDYLEKNYAPEKSGRRAPLKNIQWHLLEER